MYPDWPESAADLVPLPQCPGPKLGPFDFQGPQKIEFLEILGEGSHAIVFKVRILGQIYALKVFRWVYSYDWLGSGEWINHDYLEGLRVIYNYSEPFNAECRAFGRLQEAGCEELAVRCFGYVLLDEDHEHAMMTQFNFDEWSLNGSAEEAGYWDQAEQRLIYPGKNGRPPPFRCIVKAFGRDFDVDRGDILRQGLARQLLQSIIKLQKLGITALDFAFRQVIDGKLGDFSMAITLPHFITSPELNPHLNPAMIHAINRQTFAHCVNDYLAFDYEVWEWNLERDRDRLSIEAFPGGRCPRNTRYNLRGSRVAERTLWTFVDPRKYGWTADRVTGGANALPASQKRQARQSARIRDSKDLLRKPTARPDTWYFQYMEVEEQWASYVVQERHSIPDMIEWVYRDGYLFPVIDSSGRKLE